jgi:THO complex subunit 3
LLLGIFFSNNAPVRNLTFCPHLSDALSMAPPTRARSLPKVGFSPAFSKLKTSVYIDNPRPGASVSSAHFIRTISWNASGTFIATGAADRTLRIWNPEKTNVKNSTELRTPGAPTLAQLERVAFHPINENELASCGTDGMVRFWDIRSKAVAGEVKVGELPFTLAWTPDGTEIVVGRKVMAHTHKTHVAYADHGRTICCAQSTAQP